MIQLDQHPDSWSLLHASLTPAVASKETVPYMTLTPGGHYRPLPLSTGHALGVSHAFREGVTRQGHGAVSRQESGKVIQEGLSERRLTWGWCRSSPQ